jgi:hypothetical protein
MKLARILSIKGSYLVDRVLAKRFATYFKVLVADGLNQLGPLVRLFTHVICLDEELVELDCKGMAVREARGYLRLRFKQYLFSILSGSFGDEGLAHHGLGLRSDVVVFVGLAKNRVDLLEALVCQLKRLVLGVIGGFA